MVNKDVLEEVKNRLVETYNPIAIYSVWFICVGNTN